MEITGHQSLDWVERFKKRIYEILEESKPGDPLGKIDDVFLTLLIAINVVAMVLETVEPIQARWFVFFRVLDAGSIVIFTAEYLLRLWSITASARFSGSFRGRLRFALTPLALVDLLAIAPFYIPFLGLDLRFLRAVRLFRLFRIIKVARYSKALKSLGYAIQSRKEELLITVFTIIILLLLGSSLMYFAEHEAQPDVFASIPDAMWWGIATLTTVGYGDVYPITPLGKVLTAFVAMLGIGMFALPTGILGSAFMERLQQEKETAARCPHCGKELK